MLEFLNNLRFFSPFDGVGRPDTALSLLSGLADGDWLTNLCGLLNLLKGADFSCNGDRVCLASLTERGSDWSGAKFRSMDKLKYLDERFNKGFDADFFLCKRLFSDVSVDSESGPETDECGCCSWPSGVSSESKSSSVMSDPRSKSSVSEKERSCLMLKGGLLFKGLRDLASNESSKIKELNDREK